MCQRVVELDQLGDGSVKSKRIHIGTDSFNHAMHQLAKVFTCWSINDKRTTAVFVNEVAPDALQESLHADDVTRVPRTTGLKRARTHLVETESVGAILVVHLVRGDDVLEAFAHLAVLA